MSQYRKPCIFCKQEIKMSDNGSWLPYEVGTNEVHECRKSRQPQPQIKITLSLESLDQRISKLEELFGQRLQKIENLLFAIE